MFEEGTNDFSGLYATVTTKAAITVSVGSSQFHFISRMSYNCQIKVATANGYLSNEKFS